MKSPQNSEAAHANVDSPPKTIGAEQSGGDSAGLIRAVEAFYRKFVILPPHCALPVALWTIGTYIFELFETYPYLALLSPEKGCGKTQTTKVIALLASNPERAVCASEASLFRLIEERKPTLILDETEILSGKSDRADAVRALLNAGNSAGVSVPRCVGGSHELRYFSVYSPKVVCAIRVCPETIKDRSIVIPMQRKNANETVARFITRRVRPEAEELRKKIEDWAHANSSTISAIYERLDVDFLSDRDLENVEPLISILGAADPTRLPELQTGLEALASGKADAGEDDSFSLRLLADIRSVWPASDVNILSAELLSRLLALDEAPWGEQRLTQRGLARMLKPFGATAKTVRAGESRGRGYTRQELEDAFGRYLRPEA
jgi:Protein of unknown function (DUF3631)